MQGSGWSQPVEEVGPCEELEVTNALSGRRGWGRGPGGAGVTGVGGSPGLRRCGVPPVQADRRAFWRPVDSASFGASYHSAGLAGAGGGGGRGRCT